MLRTTCLLGLLSLAIATGCGGSQIAGAQPIATATATATPSPTPTATPTAAPAKPRPRRGVLVRTVSSPFGTIVADRPGQAFYLFDKERSRKSECYGACAKAWPPVLAKGRPVAGKGARRGLLGTTRRRDGRLQLTYRGHPMYYYVADSPGRVLCHDVVEFGGRWLVVHPDGRAAT
jgi:predicted lipoprotein with Yx(FWY)xxD motif